MLNTVMQFLVAALYACLIHEIGHVLTALAQGVPVKQIGWRGLHGPFIRRAESDSHLGEILIAAAGPLANLYAAFMLPSDNPYWLQVQLTLAFGNLLPLKNSDGARILRHAMLMLRIQRRLRDVRAGAL
jgi:Zn-dependent protease